MMRPLPFRYVGRLWMLSGGTILLVTWTMSGAAGTGSASKLPLIEGREAVASVNGEPITVDDLLRQVDLLHTGMTETKTRKPDLEGLLDRLINARLINQEARRIGLDQLPEFRSQVDKTREALVKSLLVSRQVDGITEAEPDAVEKLYRDAVRELTMDSLLFAKRDDAVAFSAAIKAGGAFEPLAARAVTDGKAQGGTGGPPIKPADLRPEIARVALGLKPGETSEPIALNDGFTVLRLLEVRYPENREARRQAQSDALEAKKQARLEDYMNALRRQYASVDQPVLASLDYESKTPGLEALRADTRVVARIKGGPPVRVKDLTAGVEAKYYHGVEGAIERKRVNDDLSQILDRIVMERATAQEAKRLGLERSPEFKATLKERTEGLLFDTFVTRVINPEVKIESGELKKYYDDHRDDYTTPPMIRLESLAFNRSQDAQAALDRLRKGADLKWMRANADGQADPAQSPSLLQFKGELLTMATLPEGLRAVVAGSRAGDVRFYGEPGGPFYVLVVRQVIAAAPQPYDAVKSDITTKKFVLSRQQRVDDWAAKLRAASDVKIFATGQALGGLLGLGMAGGA